ncbi:MAG: DUF3592 domain-containing protein [Pseudomonadota bacterium]
MNDFLPKLLQLLFIAIGLVACIYGARILARASQSRSWPFTFGVITVSRIAVTDDTSSSEAENPSYCPKIQYSYEVNGRPHTGELIAYGMKNFYGSEAYAEKYWQRYPVDKRVRVYYDPARISHSVLEPGVSVRSFTPLILGLACIVAGMFIRNW